MSLPCDVFPVPFGGPPLPPVRLLHRALLLRAQCALQVGVDLRGQLPHAVRAGLHLLAAPALHRRPVRVGERGLLCQPVDDQGEQLAALLGLQLQPHRAGSFGSRVEMYRPRRRTIRVVFSSRYVPSASLIATARSSISTVPTERSLRQRLMADLPFWETPLWSIMWAVMIDISDHASSVSRTICIRSTPPSA